MKKLLKVLIVLAFTFTVLVLPNAKAQQDSPPDTTKYEVFFLEVPSLPTKAEKEMYEEQALYTMKLMEYYSIASGLESIIRISGAKPVEKVPVPSAETITEPDFKVLTAYYRICTNLKKQVDKENILYKDQKILEFYKTIERLKRENFNLKYDNKMLAMDNSLYKSKFNNLFDKLTETNKKIDSLEMRYINELVNSNLNSLAMTVDYKLRYYPILQLKGGVSQALFFSEILDERAGCNAQLNFVPGPLWGLGEYFDVFGGINCYNIYVNNYKFNANVYNYGLDIIVPISKLIELKRFNMDFKVGLGFFNATAKAPNSTLVNSDWYGQMMRFEFNAYNTGYNFPVGIYAYYTFYYNNNNIVFPMGGGIDYSLNTNWSGAFGAGLTFPLWNVLMK
ncbi:MAG: hypothetical protein WCR42_00395 [bacterium]